MYGSFIYLLISVSISVFQSFMVPVRLVRHFLFIYLWQNLCLYKCVVTCKMYLCNIYLFTYRCLFTSVCMEHLFIYLFLSLFKCLYLQLSLSLTMTVLSSPLRCQCG